MYDCMIDESVSYAFSVYTVWMAEDSPPNNEQVGMLPTNSQPFKFSRSDNHIPFDGPYQSSWRAVVDPILHHHLQCYLDVY